MRKWTIALAASILLLAVPAFSATPSPAMGGMIGQSGSGGIQVNLTWGATSCAATLQTNGTTETAGPCYGLVFRTSVTNGASCPAFSPTAYASLTTTDPIVSTAGTFSDTTIVAGTTYCYVVEDAFQAGGAASSPSNTFQIFAILPGTPGTPTNLSGTTAQ